MRIAVIGEILWDVFPDAERLGGAPFNFAAHAARLGAQVDFFSAVASDERGRLALDRARELGLAGPRLETVEAPPTGRVSVRLERGQPEYAIHRPAAYDAVKVSDEDLLALRASRPDFLYFGTLFAHLPNPRAQLTRLLDALPDAKRFYDINLRKGSWSPALLAELLARADVLKINESEARVVEELFGGPGAGLADFARWAAEKWGVRALAITRGEDGCALWLDGRWVECAGVRVELVDAVGAGDAFAAAFLHGLAQAWEAEKIGAFANRVGALVVSRAGAIPPWRESEVWSL